MTAVFILLGVTALAACFAVHFLPPKKPGRISEGVVIAALVTTCAAILVFPVLAGLAVVCALGVLAAVATYLYCNFRRIRNMDWGWRAGPRPAPPVPGPDASGASAAQNVIAIECVGDGQNENFLALCLQNGDEASSVWCKSKIFASDGADGERKRYFYTTRPEVLAHVQQENFFILDGMSGFRVFAGASTGYTHLRKKPEDMPALPGWLEKIIALDPRLSPETERQKTLLKKLWWATTRRLRLQAAEIEAVWEKYPAERDAFYNALSVRGHLTEQEALDVLVNFARKQRSSAQSADAETGTAQVSPRPAAAKPGSGPLVVIFAGNDDSFKDLCERYDDKPSPVCFSTDKSFDKTRTADVFVYSMTPEVRKRLGINRRNDLFGSSCMPGGKGPLAILGIDPKNPGELCSNCDKNLLEMIFSAAAKTEPPVMPHWLMAVLTQNRRELKEKDAPGNEIFWPAMKNGSSPEKSPAKAEAQPSRLPPLPVMTDPETGRLYVDSLFGRFDVTDLSPKDRRRKIYNLRRRIRRAEAKGAKRRAQENDSAKHPSAPGAREAGAD